MTFPVSSPRWRQAATVACGLILLLAGCAPDSHEQIGSIYTWKADPTPEHVEAIRGLLVQPDRDVRATALHALVGLRVEDAEDLAFAAVSDEDGFVRATAAKLLADLGQPEGIEPLVTLLASDPDHVVRQRAAEALARLGGPEALEGLIRGLGDPRPNVRLASVKGVRELDPGQATPMLARLVLEDDVWEIRVQAAKGLGAAGDPSARPVLERGLEDANEFVRSAAANAIRELDREKPAAARREARD